MVEVEIFNYQSIAHTKLVIDGFTTLVGRNHLGKSAALRAINAALTNQQGTDFIRWGETYCEVRIKTPEISIIWHKENGNNFYKIKAKDDERAKKYTKIGREEPPKEVLEAGFKLLKVGDQKVNLNYAQQFHPLFLVDKQNTKSADLLTSVYGLDRLYKALDLCNKEQRSNKDALKFREKDLQITKQNLNQFEGFEELLEKMDSLKSKNSGIQSDKRELEWLKIVKTSLNKAATDFKNLKAVTQIGVPESRVIEDRILVYEALSEYRRSLHELSVAVKSLRPVVEIELSSKIISEVQSRIEEHAVLSEWGEDLARLSRSVKGLTPVQKVVLPDDRTREIKQKLDEYQQLKRWGKSIQELSGDIKKLETASSVQIPEIVDDTAKLKELSSFRDQLKALKDSMDQLKAQVEEADRELAGIEEEMKSFEICPLCEREMEGHISEHA